MQAKKEAESLKKQEEIMADVVNGGGNSSQDTSSPKKGIRFRLNKEDSHRGSSRSIKMGKGMLKKPKIL